jgi:ribosomal protein S1
MTETKERLELTNEEFDLMYGGDSYASEKRKQTKEYQEMAAIYSETVAPMPKHGDVIRSEFRGRQGSDFVLFSPGLKDYIRVGDRPSETRHLANKEVGDIVDVLITGIDNKNFSIDGSISILYETVAHNELMNQEGNEPVEARIISSNPAGYETEIIYGDITLPAFMPNTLAGINKLYDPESIVGETFDVLIESYAKKEGTYIVSRKKYLKTLIPQEIEKLENGKPYTGNVTGTTPFGVFVEFNECLTGMIHKANLNPDWQERIKEIKPGFEIDFYVKETIKNKRGSKIILTQVLRETLWDTIKDGDVIDGKVKAVKNFGVLVSLDHETVGLIYSSEVEKLNKSFDKGDNVKVKVLSIDREKRKIFLTMVK